MTAASQAEPQEQLPPLRTSTCPVLIAGVWYDCAGWAKAHPGGERWLHFFAGRDATAAFYALHSVGANGSDVALKRLEKLPICAPPKEKQKLLPDAASVALCDDFEDFRLSLEADGWFKREPLKEVQALSTVLGLCAAGTFVAADHPVVATILIGLGMQQAGWLGHDYLHGRGWWCELMNGMGSLINGHSGRWWVQKHSLHHTFTNVDTHDEDIMQEPFFFLEPPSKTGRPDHPARKFQHLYGYPLYSLTFAIWRIASLHTIITEGAFSKEHRRDTLMMAANYLWLACLPWQVALGSVLLSGFLVGSLVSATHQSEEIMNEQGEFVELQFRSTRDAEVNSWLGRFLWGGMDTQLEHHLFPTMPRYKYHELRPLVQAFAASRDESRGIKYRMSPGLDIVMDNWKTIYNVSQAP